MEEDIEIAKQCAWARGYIQAIRDYGIWNNGSQTIGCLDKPIKEIIKEVAESIGMKPEDF